MATYILCYPKPSSSPATQRDWLHLADWISRVGGRILVIEQPDQAEQAAPVTDEVYAAHTGALFPHPTTSGPLFLCGAGDSFAAQLVRAGLPVKAAPAGFGGQADLISLPRNRYLLTHGTDHPEQTARLAALVKELLPLGARLLEVPLRSSGAGLSCFGALWTPGNDGTLLCYAGGLAQHTLAEISRFVGGDMVVPVAPEDAALGATFALAVRNALALPPGCSSTLRGALVRRGFLLTELALPHLLPAGGLYGLRSLVNELPGYVLSDDAPSYALRRDELHRRVQSHGA